MKLLVKKEDDSNICILRIVQNPNLENFNMNEKISQVKKERKVDFLNFNDASASLSSSIQISYYILKKTGEFIVAENQTAKTVQFVWLALSRSRVLWGEYDPSEKNVAPLCRSANAILPDNGTAKRECKCENCPDSQWTKDSRHNDIRPACAEIFKMLCFDTERKIPFYFQVKRTGISFFLAPSASNPANVRALSDFSPTTIRAG